MHNHLPLLCALGSSENNIPIFRPLHLHLHCALNREIPHRSSATPRNFPQSRTAHLKRIERNQGMLFSDEPLIVLRT
jgi:hypothetical protein